MFLPICPSAESPKLVCIDKEDQLVRRTQDLSSADVKN
jgi:hypothetical protein